MTTRKLENCGALLMHGIFDVTGKLKARGDCYYVVHAT